MIAPTREIISIGLAPQNKHTMLCDYFFIKSLTTFDTSDFVHVSDVAAREIENALSQ